MQIYSVSNSQHEILNSITRMYLKEKPFHLDPCFGRGSFYNDTTFPVHLPLLKNDKKIKASQIDIFQNLDITNYDCRKMPHEDQTIISIMFDPPWLAGSDNLMTKKYGGFKTIKELFSFLDASLQEIARVLVKGGYLVCKIQDFTHGKQKYFPSIFEINTARNLGVHLVDTFIFVNKNRFRAKNAGTASSISAHCYFHVFKKEERAKRINRY